MPKANNKVIEGYGKDKKVKNYINEYIYFEKSNPYNTLPLTKGYVTNYDVLTEDKVKSASSAILRGIVGTVALGGLGILAGLSAKNKSVYLIAIEFKDGQ
jgi:hypothetical protein